MRNHKLGVPLISLLRWNVPITYRIHGLHHQQTACDVLLKIIQFVDAIQRAPGVIGTQLDHFLLEMPDADSQMYEESLVEENCYDYLTRVGESSELVEELHQTPTLFDDLE